MVVAAAGVIGILFVYQKWKQQREAECIAQEERDAAARFAVIPVEEEDCVAAVEAV